MKRTTSCATNERSSGARAFGLEPNDEHVTPELKH